MQKIGDIPNTRADSNGEFTDGNVAGGVPPTILPAEWFNTIQRELISILDAAGITPNSEKFDQIAEAISTLVSKGDFLKTKNNLSEIKAAGDAAVAQAIANLGLTDAAAAATGAMQKAQNLNDVANKATALTNLGALAVGGTAVAATKLATARTIAGKPFDGTANISIADLIHAI
ncbi:bacteriophage tail fiber protein [Yersinia pekkanenii]|uniref:Bacteriophage tail fiber protein n=1 Tax=Yersinia pekkanenii TaxID=1288385 RepID=A0A0T9RLD2_9GAMM|nr:bacteriophage tail fiber protein [Yersinia pekkanenii]